MASAFANGFLADVSQRIIKSVNTGEDYEILVSVPPSYGNDEHERYPVLIVLDGNYCFGTAVETARTQGTTGEAEELIVVGVCTPGGLENHFLRRLRDYTPGHAFSVGKERERPFSTLLTRHLNQLGIAPESATGGIVAFTQFLKHELLPQIVAKYRVAEQNIGLVGHSAGGSAVVDILLRGAAPFTKLIVGTFVSVWYPKEELERLEREFAGSDAEVFVAIGGAEFKDIIREEIEDALSFLDRLKVAHPDLKLRTRIYEDETHTSLLAILLASGIRALWPTGNSYIQGLYGEE